MTTESATATDTARSRYRTAGAVYFLLGSAVMAITVLTPGLASPERRSDLVQLLVGVPFFALFAALIAWGDRLVGSWAREKLTMLLTLTGLGRVFVFTANGLGHKPRLDFETWSLSLESIDPMPRMLLNALLMSTIVAFLVRAAWIPFFERHRVGR